MTLTNLRLLTRARTAPARDRRRPDRPTTLGGMLVASAALSQVRLDWARRLQNRQHTRLEDILRAHGLVSEAQLVIALARLHRAEIADFSTCPPDARMVDEYGVDVSVRTGVLPWKRMGAVTAIATAYPDRFEVHRKTLEAMFGPVAMAVAGEKQLQKAVLKLRRRALAAKAETRVRRDESCRELAAGPLASLWLILVLTLAFMTVIRPEATFAVLAFWAIATLVLTSGLRTAAAIVHLRQRHRRHDPGADLPAPPVIARLPTVSVLVPLFREREIAQRLIRRLKRLDYPGELLDICLIVEEDDTITQAAIHSAKLPGWMRQIAVPRGSLKTKPRALNYALEFCRGTIVGVYDAEDAPARDQIRRVVRRFHERGPEVACLQGVLDFYNARENWLSRCFAVDYATWFGIILPGLARLGLVIPLGGTTVFFRREALEALGGWDAHNVTEDADLGLRLARRGYQTELLPTVTEEEANCRLWPWIKQRSRWLKGYAITYAVHMRAPLRLWSDLGPWRFFGVQVLFFGTLSQFALAPILWSFWLLPLGLTHPLAGVLPTALLLGLGALFILAEVLTIAVGCIAVAGAKHRWLIPWVPSLHFYFPLGAVAAYKGLYELVARPFYWDKTAHGLSRMSPLPERAMPWFRRFRHRA